MIYIDVAISNSMRLVNNAVGLCWSSLTDEKNNSNHNLTQIATSHSCRFIFDVIKGEG